MEARASRFTLPAADAAAPAMTPAVPATLPAESPTQPSRLSGTQDKTRQDVSWSASALAPAPDPTVGVLNMARVSDDVDGGAVFTGDRMAPSPIELDDVARQDPEFLQVGADAKGGDEAAAEAR